MTTSYSTIAQMPTLVARLGALRATAGAAAPIIEARVVSVVSGRGAYVDVGLAGKTGVGRDGRRHDALLPGVYPRAALVRVQLVRAGEQPRVRYVPVCRACQGAGHMQADACCPKRVRAVAVYGAVAARTAPATKRAPRPTRSSWCWTPCRPSLLRRTA